LVAVVSILIAVSLAGFLVGEKIRLAQAPAIHDVTTNLDDPPSFQAIKVRGDLLAGVPTLNRPGYASLSSYEQWKAVHADAYGDLRPLELKTGPVEALARAAAVAQRYGWRVVRADPRHGVLEAVSSTRFFGMEDDIVMRARQSPGGGTVVDVRSVSRTGISDHGRGARNIRRLLSGLQG
jgi:uncharacterized protein (DUF1499 family)